jgi:hypothetical protein
MSGQNQAQIKVIRRTMVQDLARRHTVIIDDNPVGKLAAFQTGTYDVAPGTHKVRMAILVTGSSTSAEIEVTLGAGETKRLRTRSRGFKNFILLPLSLFNPSRYAKGPWILLELIDQ